MSISSHIARCVLPGCAPLRASAADLPGPPLSLPELQQIGASARRPV